MSPQLDHEGRPTERDRLLSASSEGRSNGSQDGTTDEFEAVHTLHSGGLVSKLGASMFDFFITGCGMAAVGVGRS